MIPSFSTLFNKTTIKALITDTFDYTTLIYDAVYGNIKASIGNTIFHNNTNYDSSADIVIGTNTSKSIDLPVSNLLIQPGSYSFQYSEKIVNQVLYASGVSQGFIPCTFGSSPITHATITTPDSSIVAAVQALQAQGLDVRCGIYNAGGTLLASPVITTLTSSQINFLSTTYSGTPTKIRIIGTNIWTTTQVYTYSNCDPIIGVLCANPNCFTSQLTVIDATVIPAYVTTLSRVLTINYPRLANGTPVAAPVVTTDASKTIGPNIYSGTYTIALVDTMSWTQTDGLMITEVLTVYDEPNVQCDAGLCTIAPCVNSVFNKYLSALKNGSRDLSNLTIQNSINQGYFMTYTMAVNCANTNLATKILSDWKQYLGDTGNDCGCGCNDSSSSTDQTEPTVIIPLYQV